MNHIFSFVTKVADHTRPPGFGRIATAEHSPAEMQAAINAHYGHSIDRSIDGSIDDRSIDCSINRSIVFFCVLRFISFN